MKNIGLILLLSLISLRADAYPDSLKGLEYRNLAGEFLIEDCLDSVAHYKTLSLEIFKQNQDLGNWINVFKYLGRFYRDQTNNPEFAINEFQNATEENLWRSPNDDEEWKVLGWLYVNIAYTHWRFLGDYKKARTYYEKAKSILSEKLAIEDLLVGQYLFRELGNIYTRLGDYSAAQVLHKKFIDISINEKQYGKAAEAYSDLGLCYFATQQFDQAIEMYKTGLLLPDLGKRPKALLYFNLTKA